MISEEVVQLQLDSWTREMEDMEQTLTSSHLITINNTFNQRTSIFLQFLVKVTADLQVLFLTVLSKLLPSIPVLQAAPTLQVATLDQKEGKLQLQKIKSQRIEKPVKIQIKPKIQLQSDLKIVITLLITVRNLLSFQIMILDLK